MLDWKSCLHISLYTRLLSPQPSDCCTVDYPDHPSVWLHVTSTYQLMQHGRLVFLHIPVVYQRLLDTISIRWTLNQENSSLMPHEAPKQPVVSSFECCLDFFSWKASNTEHWTGMCSAKAIFLGDICWNVSWTEYWIISLWSSASRGFLSAFSFLKKSWHLTVLADIYGAGTLHPRAPIVATWADRFSWRCWRRFSRFLTCPLTLPPVPASHCLSCLLHAVAAIAARWRGQTDTESTRVTLSCLDYCNLTVTEVRC